MADLKGASLPEKRKGRAILSARDPNIEHLLGGLGVEAELLQDLRSFGKKLWSDRNRWDVNRRGGLFGARRLTKEDADRALRRELAAIGGEL